MLPSSSNPDPLNLTVKGAVPSVGLAESVLQLLSGSSPGVGVGLGVDVGVGVGVDVGVGVGVGEGSAHENSEFFAK
ncbi:hypothetical protein A2V80_00905 [Candidatus Woesebacteria bacterium RBG_16_39_8b]|uniref:Uncharacterized protein n=1 Tax=Candidatus Woesebacteria bacterium RBG_16_39_8b TaxID=1802482 RepID=A0A1F7XDT3_9BACT|nr:MAG: hypothetical protein A2V80_00905 [Candidatus Woesebacteria bacterium RBG_16_39_8b]